MVETVLPAAWIDERPLAGKVALVAGATRGCGRAIARALGEAGATTWCTGRTTRASRSPMNRPETIEETAELIEAAGGTARWRQVDHRDTAQVAALVEEIRATDGRLDILVNDVYGGDSLMQFSTSFWEADVEQGIALIRLTLETHLVTARYAVPLLLETGAGSTVIEITDGHTDSYRAELYFDLAKSGINRFGWAMAQELKDHGVPVVTVSPGFLRSEAMLDIFGVTEATWRDAIAREPFYAESETPAYTARGIVAMLRDPDRMARTGTAVYSGDLADAYGFDDLDGRHPHFWRFYEARQQDPEAPATP